MIAVLVTIVLMCTYTMIFGAGMEIADRYPNERGALMATAFIVSAILAVTATLLISYIMYFEGM